jgi:hypothetical protein
MKSVLFILLLLPQLLFGQTAEDILNSVKAQLPKSPLTLTGRFRQVSITGQVRTRLPARALLHLGKSPSQAYYQIGEQELHIEWLDDQPTFTFSPEGATANDFISASAMRWHDLGFSFLWWPDARLIRATQKLNRPAWLIEIPVPNQNEVLHLWVDQSMQMLLEAQRLNEQQKKISTLRIKRLKKINEHLWFPKLIEIMDHTNGERTSLTLDRVEIGT